MSDQWQTQRDVRDGGAQEGAQEGAATIPSLWAEPLRRRMNANVCVLGCHVEQGVRDSHQRSQGRWLGLQSKYRPSEVTSSGVISDGLGAKQDGVQEAWPAP